MYILFLFLRCSFAYVYSILVLVYVYSILVLAYVYSIFVLPKKKKKKKKTASLLYSGVLREFDVP